MNSAQGRPRVTVATITIKTARPSEVARFWRDLLGYTVAPNRTDSILLAGDGPALLVQPAEQDQAQGAIHLDLRPDDQAEAVERALRLGATPASIGQAGDEGWTVLADPAGNLFCILQSARAHAAQQANAPGTPTPIDDN